MHEGALDHVVDSLSAAPQHPPLSGAVTASGESPGVVSDYHLDQHVDRRQPFAKSAAQDGGLVILDAPNPLGGSAREALLASNQDQVGAGAVVVMRPRAVEQQRGDGKARRGTGALVNPTDIGLAMRPIMIQRQADVDEMGQAVNPEGITPQLFASDGTVAGARRIDESGSVIAQPRGTPKTGSTPLVAAAAIPYTPGGVQHQAAVVVVAPPTQKQRIIYEPPGGGKIRASAEDVIVSDTMILVIADANSDTAYEPAPNRKEAPIKLSVGTDIYEVLYGGWSAEKNGKLYLVFIRLPKATP
jgi:hypothetical protein